MGVRTRLTDRLGIKLPILSAPMAYAAGGKLAAAVTAAGGLGIIGGGYGDAAWLKREFAAAGNARVGCGFITWSLAKQPELLDQVLTHAPTVVMLSFGDPKPFAPAIHNANSRLICQVQTIAHARAALDCGADIIVAQGSEAGGHGATRATLTLVPEVADLIARDSPGKLLVAAGGIADGRGLAAWGGRGDVGLTTVGKLRKPGASQPSTCCDGYQRRRHRPPDIRRHRVRL